MPKIPMYWWDGTSSYKRALLRRLQGKNPKIYNFGDWLSPFIVQRMSGKPVSLCESNFSPKLLAVGSVMSNARSGDWIWGSGFLSQTYIGEAKDARNLKIFAVRGPGSARILRNMGHDVPEIFGDPASLLPRLIDNDINVSNEIGIVPHYSQFSEVKRFLRNDPNIFVIDVTQSLEKVIKDILSCQKIFSMSLHGLIVAHAYAIPAKLLLWKKPLHEDLFKFEDHFNSLNADLDYETCLNSDQLKKSLLCDPKILNAFNLDTLWNSFPFPKNSISETRIGWKAFLK